MEKVKEQVFKQQEKSQDFANKQKTIAQRISGEESPSAEYYEIADQLLSDQQSDKANSIESALKKTNSKEEKISLSPEEIIDRSWKKISQEATAYLLWELSERKESPEEIVQKHYPDIFKPKKTEMYIPSEEEVDRLFERHLFLRPRLDILKEIGESRITANEANNALKEFIQEKEGHLLVSPYEYVMDFCERQNKPTVSLGNDPRLSGNYKGDVYTISKDDLADLIRGYAAYKIGQQCWDVLMRGSRFVEEHKIKREKSRDKIVEDIIEKYEQQEIRNLLKKPDLVWVNYVWKERYSTRGERPNWDDVYYEMDNYSFEDYYAILTGIFYKKHNKLYSAKDSVANYDSHYYNDKNLGKRENKKLAKKPLEIMQEAIDYAKNNNLTFVGMRINHKEMVSAEKLKAQHPKLVF